MGARPLAGLIALDDEQIRALLTGIEPPSQLRMPVPPNMTPISAAEVADAGGDVEQIEAWVKARLGWAKRIPPQFLSPEASSERDALMFLVPDKELAGAGAGGSAGAAAGTPAAGPPSPGRGAAPAARGNPPPVLESAGLVAFMPTTNLTQARAFYGTMLGLTMEGESPIAVTFDANGTTLRCVLVERFTPFPFTIVGWTGQDIATTVGELTARGIAFERFEGIQQDSLGVWRSPGGAQVAWFKDPSGNTISLTQF